MVSNPAFLDSCSVLPSPEDLEAVLSTPEATSLWGVGTVAPIHLGYDSLIVLQKHLIASGFQHTILLADYHAMMTHGLSAIEATERANYYEAYLKHHCGLDATFIKGSSFQTRPDYVEELYAILSEVTISKVKESLSKVSKGEGPDSTKVSAFLYGLMQCLDCCYLRSKVVFAEKGQAKIYELLSSFTAGLLSKSERFSHLGAHRSPQTPNVFVYASTGCDAKGNPLNASRSEDRISIHEDRASLERKIKGMFAAPPNQPLPIGRANALLEFFKWSVFPWREEPVKITVGSEIQEYSNFEAFGSDYALGVFHPNDCKMPLTEAIWTRLQEVQKDMGNYLSHWVDVQKAIGKPNSGEC